MLASLLCKREWRGVSQRLFLSLLTVAIVSACSSTVVDRSEMLTAKLTSTPCRVVQHIRGETCIPLNPQRIIALSQTDLGHLLALNSKPVGAFLQYESVDNMLYLGEKRDGVELMYGSQLNLEQVVLLHPDLIIVISYGTFNGIYNQLSQIAPTVVLPWMETKGDWKQHLKDVARVLEKTELATQLLNDYDHHVQNLKQVLSVSSAADHKGAASTKESRQQPIRASLLYISGGQLRYTRKTFGNRILDELGLLKPISGILDIPNSMISEETLPEIDSDILFIATYSDNDRSVLKQLQRKPLWFKLKAVQQNQVYFVNSKVWYGFNILAAHAVLDDIEKYLVNTP
ncbi:iron-siderophore ABC transporter substrate-binding protein [Chlorogloeopsis sp. ULAP01]|uniref:iron-siderophore ABC transporter substrate-binding protein n=1 Tax=Chlorogloeopsis sp. ULAP01 TaxID=3056483 RepID=UPI0025ACAC02|nr:iron-siderophore ABC transporter substrate-binding protein [Chlorogloeopsis sp. ULAP01]